MHIYIHIYRTHTYKHRNINAHAYIHMFIYIYEKTRYEPLAQEIICTVADLQQVYLCAGYIHPPHYLPDVNELWF